MTDEVQRTSNTVLDYPEPPADPCKTCGNEKEWTDCWNCGGEGFSNHD